VSNDYVSRLRAELLRAGAAGHAPRRAGAARRLRPLVAAVAVLLLIVAGAVVVRGGDRRGSPGQDAATVTYRVPAGDATQAAQILRERLGALGVTADVRAGDGTLTITAPPEAQADVTALTAPGRLEIYDWEASVLGPDGSPAPADSAITGGPDAGHAAALTEAEARSRAAKCPGAVVLRADSGWFALGGIAAVTNADIAKARAATDPAGGPDVELSLTPHGQEAFTTLTRELARRGTLQAHNGDPLQSSQHLAIVLDGRIVSTPYVNWREAPDGIDGADGVPISGLRTAAQASRTAALLSAGPLPRLEG
jgi:preprotein translocase subunit SecD